MLIPSLETMQPGDRAVYDQLCKMTGRRLATEDSPGWRRKRVVWDHTGRITELYLDDLYLAALPKSVGKLTNLTELSLSDNQLTALPESLGNLTKLTTLSLSDNQLTALPESLGNLTNLTGLSLGGNQLPALPESLGNLTNLTELYLSDNQLPALPESLGNLTKLTELYLDNNQLTALPESLGKLTNLTELSLSDNQLTALPESLGNLTNLTTLYLSGNQLTALPESLGNLTNLTGLSLGGNQLTALPESLGKLTKLTALWLNGNRLTALPEWLGKLTNLTTLSLGGNQLTALPESLGNLTKLRYFSVEDNPLHTPPLEICKQGIDETLSFLREITGDNGVTRYEGKLLVLGEGFVGKTKFICYLRGKTYETHRTHGVDVDRHEMAHPDTVHLDGAKQLPMGLSIWDFEGQTISHTTHQFFLTAHSLYLLLWNARAGDEQSKVRGWLKTITSRAKDARILLVATYADPDRHDEAAPRIDYAELHAAYPQNLIGQMAISNESGMGRDELCERIRTEFARLPLMGQRWPRKWVAVENALAECAAANEYKIDRAKYLEICRNAGIDDEISADSLARYLHSLGRIVYFIDRGDDLLYDLLILQPEWLTKAISRVLNSETVKNANGVLDHGYLRELWGTPNSDGEAYARIHYPKFLQLMEAFDLSYRIDQTHSLIPLKLPIAPPANLPVPTEQDESVEILYAIQFLPPGILARFIARTHAYKTDRHWVDGVVLSYKNQTARVELDQSVQPAQIRMRVWGASPENFIGMLMGTLEDVIGILFPELKARLEEYMRVPCCCKECAAQTDPNQRYLFAYTFLVNIRENRQANAQCQKSADMVSVTQLLMGLSRSTAEEVQQQILQTVKQTQEQLGQMHEEMTRSFFRQWNHQMQQQSRECPALFEITTADGSPFNPRRLFTTPLRLNMVCQDPACPHLTGKYYDINEAKEWFAEISPWLKRISGLLTYVPIATATGTLLGAPKEIMGLVKEIAAKIPGVPKESPVPTDRRGTILEAEEGKALAKLYDFFASAGAMQGRNRIGDLQRTVIEDGSILWLCDEHRQRYNPPEPIVP